MNHVYRNQRIEGTTVWGIIRNGSYYFLNTFGVYEDGIISCWNKNDLWQFEHELNRGWVVTSIPTNERVSIFHLGDFKVKDAVWNYNQTQYYQYIKDVVKQLNPEMKNLYRTTPREIEKWNKHRVGFSAEFTPFKLTSSIGYFCEDGKQAYIFYRKNSSLYLTTITAYKDGTLKIGLDDSYHSWEEIDRFFEDDILCVTSKENEWVTIPDFGKVLFEDEPCSISTSEKKSSIYEMRKEIMDEPTAHDLCIEAYYQYLIEPCNENKERLRKAYEAVPEFERCYLGNMDTRDSDFVRILYSNEKRMV